MLKFWAVVFMTLDHIGYYLQPFLPAGTVLLLRAAGRLAFPIFAYHVARGYTLTRNPARYFLRMLLFAFGTEAVIRLGYAMAGLTMHWTNVMFTFALGIAMITGFRLMCRCGRDMIASLHPITTGPASLPPPRYDVRVNIFGIDLDARIGAVIGFILMFAAMVTAYQIQSDYDIYGLLTVLIFYIVLEQPDPRCSVQDCRKLHDHHDPFHERQAFWLLLGLNALFTLSRLNESTPLYWSLLQNLSLLAVPIIFHARPERRPGPFRKYFFYVYYPLHIFLLLMLRTALQR